MSPTLPTAPGQNLHFDRTGTGPINSNLGSGEQANSTQTGGRNNRLLYVKDYHEYGRSRTPNNDDTPPPFHNLPFLRDDEFVERLELTELQQKLASPGKRVALSGIGGVGKSQLALEYCYRQRDEKPDIWVLWIHAGSAARYDDDMRSLSERVKIPGRDSTQANIHQLVQGWLGDARNGKWLLVVDNVDDIETLADSPKNGSSDKLDNVVSKSRLEYLPVCDHGSILFTTRRRTVAAKLVDDHDIIDVLPNEQHAEEILKIKLEQSSSADTNKKLAAALEYMPLAIAQAIAYIRHSQPLCTPEDYLAMLEESDDMKAQLLSEVAEEVRRDFREASNSIILSWQISFEHIRAKRKSAADLLSLMSFYNHQGTPRFLLEDALPTELEKESISSRFKVAVKEIFAFHAKHKHADRSKRSNSYQPLLSQDTLDGDIKVLRDYSFISSKFHKDTFEMHRLVQLAAQVWLKTKGSFDKWQSESIHRLSADFPVSEREQWIERKRCHVLYLHARLALDWHPTDYDTQLAFAQLMHLASRFGRTHALRKQAEIMCRRALDIRNNLLAAGDVRLLVANTTLAMILMDEGKYDLAEQHCRKSLSQAERSLGKKHEEVLSCYNLLAEIHLRQRKSTAGYQLLVRVVRSRQKLLGNNHPDTLKSMATLAESLYMLDKYQDAEEAIRETLKLQNGVLKPGHPDLMDSMNTLALILPFNKKSQEASMIYRELLAITRGTFGESHPATLFSLHNYGLALHANAEFKEAEVQMLHALEEGKKLFGNEHPEMLQQMHNIAWLYADMGRLDEAVDLMDRATKARARIFRDDHPDVINGEKCLQQFVELRDTRKTFHVVMDGKKQAQLHDTEEG